MSLTHWFVVAHATAPGTFLCCFLFGRQVLEGLCAKMRGYLLVEPPETPGRFEFQRMGSYVDGQVREGYRTLCTHVGGSRRVETAAGNHGTPMLTYLGDARGCARTDRGG